MALFGSASNASTTNPTQGDLSKDVPLSNPPEDSISSIRFSPQSDHLAVASWDKKVRIYEFNQQGQSEGKALFEHEGPVLCCDWSRDGTKVFGGGTDKAVRMLDLQAGGGQAQQVAAHDAPIRCIQAVQIQGNPVLVTGSWDKTVKYWDLRQQQPVAAVNCQDRVYSMDSRSEMLVIATADRYLNIIDLNKPADFFNTMQSQLKWQTRVVSCFYDGTGFAVGSIEGRCSIQYVKDKDASMNFSFKCHRAPPSNPADRNASNVFAINDISFHPQHGTFSTAGSDGTFHFWDGIAKHRLKGYPEVGGAITSTDFDHNGNIFAYAISYDWSKGYAHNNPQYPTKIMLHPIQGDECKPKPGSKKR